MTVKGKVEKLEKQTDQLQPQEEDRINVIWCGCAGRPDGLCVCGAAEQIEAARKAGEKIIRVKWD